MKIFKTIFACTIVLSLLLTATACRDSSMEDDFNESAVISNATTATGAAVNTELDTSEQLSIGSATSGTALSDITLSKDLSGSINIDGSALMSAISDKIAEQFRTACPKMSIKIGVSGTEDGISKFSAQKIDICNTSRQLTAAEVSAAKATGVDFIELKVAYDGVVIAVNKDNPIDSITLKEVKSIWNPDSSIISWKEVNAKWPDNELLVFGPKANTGLIEFFTKSVLNTSGNQIGVYTEVSSDKELIKSLSGDNTSIGLTTFANYFNSKNSIKALKVDFGQGPVAPDIDSIKNGKYNDLSSPMYLYVSKTALQRIEVKAFVKYYLENASKIVTDAGYVPLADKDYSTQLLSALN